MEVLFVDHEQQATVRHNLARSFTWLQRVEGDRNIDHGGKTGPAARGAAS